MSEYEKRLVRLAGHAVETAAFFPARAKGVVILAHGRINDLDHPALLAAAQGAHLAGWGSYRFNFPYRQRGDAEPDSFTILTEVHAAAARKALLGLGSLPGRLVLAGKSLGARTAAAAARTVERTEGLLFLGYPLHPPDQPENLRDKPLYGLGLPIGIVQGDSDALCDLNLLSRVLSMIRPAPTLTIVPQADHGFGLPGGDHEPPALNLEIIQEAVRGWLAGLG